MLRDYCKELLFHIGVACISIFCSSLLFSIIAWIVMMSQMGVPNDIITDRTVKVLVVTEAFIIIIVGLSFIGHIIKIACLAYIERHRKIVVNFNYKKPKPQPPPDLSPGVIR